MLQYILLATDGSAVAERAADLAASLGVRYTAKVTVLQALPGAGGEVGIEKKNATIRRR